MEICLVAFFRQNAKYTSQKQPKLLIFWHFAEILPILVALYMTDSPQ